MFKFFPVFYREEGGSPAGSPTPPATPATPAAPSAKDFASELMKALEERTSRAENGVLKSMATQYGMTEDEARSVFEKAKADKAAKLPESAQKQIQDAVEKANSRLISAEIKSLGVGMGLLDADVAMQLLDREKLKVDDNGEITGVKEALEELQKNKPYLFGTAKPAAMAQRVSGSAPGALSSLEERFYERNPELRPK
jgi:uncharacterized protein YfiM (DUF2279 family)